MDGKPVLIDVLRYELDLHPHATPIDLRKLVMQSVLGGDHLLRDPERFRAGLRAEWGRILVGSLEAAACLDAVQLINPNGAVARIHLAPCKRIGISVNALADLLLSQRRKNGSRQEDADRWSEVTELARTGQLPFDAQQLKDLAVLDGAPHHSPSYGFASYRILNDLRDPEVTTRLRRWGVLP